jgi:hypothetical protein
VRPYGHSAEDTAVFIIIKLQVTIPFAEKMGFQALPEGGSDRALAADISYLGDLRFCIHWLNKRG